MFGEKPIVGQTIIRIRKDKIVLPEFTGVEPGEELFATLDKAQRKIIIMNRDTFYKELEEKRTKLKLAYQNKIIGYDKYNYYIRIICGILALNPRTVTQKKEFVLHSHKDEDIYDLEKVRRLNLKEQVFAVGTEKALEIYPSEEAYHDYQVFQEEQKKKLIK